MGVYNRTALKISGLLTPYGLAWATPLIMLSFVLILVYIFFKYVIPLVFCKKTGPKRKGIVLIGPNNSGKTSLFCYLITNAFKPTVSSLKLNQAVYSFTRDNSKWSVPLHDVPGYPYHYEESKQTVLNAQAIVIMADSTNNSCIDSIGDFLYPLIDSEALVEGNVPIIVACNKQDQVIQAKRATLIENDVERKIEQLKSIKKTSEESGYMEHYHQKFSFATFPLSVKFCECSILKGEIADLKALIESNIH